MKNSFRSRLQFWSQYGEIILMQNSSYMSWFTRCKTQFTQLKTFSIRPFRHRNDHIFNPCKKLPRKPNCYLKAADGSF